MVPRQGAMVTVRRHIAAKSRTSLYENQRTQV